MPDDSPEDQMNSFPTSEAWSAYVLGRHPYAIFTWLANHWQRARESWPCQRPWNSPWEDFCQPLDDVPWLWFEDLDQAIRNLVLARTVSAAPLVEVHRGLDQLARLCEELVQAFLANDHELVIELYDDRRYLLSEIVAVAGLMVEGPELREWWRLGETVGACLQQTAEMLMEPYRLLDFQTGFDSPVLDTVWPLIAELKFRADTRSEDELPTATDEFERWLISVDGNLLKAVSETNSVEVVLIIDESKEEFILLGEVIPFQTLREQGYGKALDCFLVLARKPSQFMKVEQIQADANTESHVLTQYFSRIRKVFRPVIKRHLARIPREVRTAAATEFIEAQRGRTNVNLPTKFRLALQPAMVKFC